MAENLKHPPTETLRLVANEAGLRLRALRNDLLAAGPLDRATCELIVIAGLGMAGFEDSFKIHTRRLIEMKVPWAAIRQAVMLPLAASAAAFQVARALQWVDELEAEAAARNKRRKSKRRKSKSR